MIRVMTLDVGATQGHEAKRLRAAMEGVRQAGIDLLCCQSVGRGGQHGEEASRMLAEATGLTCSCFVPAGPGQGGSEGSRGGLAILTGAGTWTLNSGSLGLALEPGGAERLAQFALVRKGMASMLVLNLQLAATASEQVGQLRGLFDHSLLKDPYGAVVLCADRQPLLEEVEFKAMAGRVGYAPRRSMFATAAGATEGLLCLLATRDSGQFDLTLGVQEPWWPGVTQGKAVPPGLAIAFALNRSNQKRTRPFLPLSFREQWLGSRENYRAFVA